MRYSISKELLEVVMQYISTKPYREVAKLLSDLQNDIKPVGDEGNAEESVVSMNKAENTNVTKQSLIEANDARINDRDERRAKVKEEVKQRLINKDEIRKTKREMHNNNKEQEDVNL